MTNDKDRKALSGKPAWANGTYQTSEGQTARVMVNGEKVRVGPNTTITRTKKKSKVPAWIDSILKEEKPSGVAGVRG